MGRGLGRALLVAIALAVAGLGAGVPPVHAATTTKAAASYDYDHSATFALSGYRSPLHLAASSAPSSAALHAAFASVHAVNRIGNAAKAEVRWVDEAAAMSDDAAAYQAGAIGARSNAVTRAGQAPELYGVRFDGFDDLAGVLIDRKVAVTTFAKSQRQALRQSEALARGGYRGLWEVPNSAQAARAQRMFGQLGISNIDVAVVPR